MTNSWKEAGKPWSMGADGDAYKAKNERLKKIIGKQAIQIEILEKTEERFEKK